MKRLICLGMVLALLGAWMPLGAAAETGEEPVCICGTACSEEARNEECAVCSADIGGCAGTAPEEKPDLGSGDAEHKGDAQGSGDAENRGDAQGSGDAENRDEKPSQSAAPTALPEGEPSGAVEMVQGLIDGLPEAEDITEENREDVVKLLEAIDEAKAELSDEELAKLNFDKYEAAASALGEDHTPALLAPDSRTICARVEENKVGTLTLAYYLLEESTDKYNDCIITLKYPTDTLVLKSCDAPEGAVFAGDGFTFSYDIRSGRIAVFSKLAQVVTAGKTLFTATFEVRKTREIPKTELGFAEREGKPDAGGSLGAAGRAYWTDGGLVLSEGTSLSVTRGTDFDVTGGTEGEDWAYNAGDETLEIKSEKPLSIKMKDGVTSTTNRIEVIADVDTGNLTLDGVHIETNSDDGAVAAYGDLNLTLKGVNTIVNNGKGVGVSTGNGSGSGNLNLYGDGGLKTNMIFNDWEVSICGNVTLSVDKSKAIRSGGVSFASGVQASVNARIFVDGDETNPTRDGEETCLLTIQNPEGKTVTIDGTVWNPCNSKLLGDTTLYAYVTKPDGDLAIQVGDKGYLARYDETTETFSYWATITYSKGDADGLKGETPASGTKQWGNQAYKLLGETYTREGFVQSGWKDQNGNEYALFGEYTGDFNLTLEPTWEKIVEVKIPFRKTVEQKHGEKPGKTTFVLDMEKGNDDVTVGETKNVKVTASVETNGKGTYDSYLTFTGPAEEIVNFAGGGLYVWEKDNGLKNWEYDDTVYYVIVDWKNNVELEYTIYGTKVEKNGKDTYVYPDYDKELEYMTFVNQYVKKPSNADPTNPKCGDEIGLAVAVMVSAGWALAVLARKRRKA